MTNSDARLAAAAVLSAAGCPLDGLDAAARAMWREIEVARLVGRAELAKELADKVLREAKQSETDVRFAVLDREPMAAVV